MEKKYSNMLSDLKEKFPEFKILENSQLEMVIKLYDDHMNTRFYINNPAYHVIGSMLLLSSFMFTNSLKLESPSVDYLGFSPAEREQARTAIGANAGNSPQKVIMITVLASSVCGLGYILTRSVWKQNTHQNFGCYHICNAMLSGVVSVSASCTGIEVWQSTVIAGVACVFYSLGSKLYVRAEIDDPLECSLVYGVVGLWAVVAAGLFDNEKGLLTVGSAR